MDLPEYTGEAMSAMVSLAPTESVSVDLWGWVPMWMPHESTQKAMDWYRDDTTMPVLLAFSISHQPQERVIPLLNPFPLPQIGEYAILDKGDGENVVCYHIKSLPAKSRQRREAIGELLRQLSEPLLWPTFTEQHTIASDGNEYQRTINDLETRRMLLPYGDLRLHALAEVALHESAQMQIWQLREMLKRETCKAQWEEVQRMAKELGDDYCAYHTRITGNKPTPDIANVFHNKVADAYCAIPFQAFPAATISKKAKLEADGEYRGGDWSKVPGDKENDLILSFPYTKPSGMTYVQIREDATGRSREQVLANMWEQSIKYSDLDSDVYLARLVQLTNGVKDEQGNTWITGQQILKYRGIQPKKNKTDIKDQRTGGPRWEEMEEIAACVTRERNTFIKIAEMSIYDDSEEEKPRRKRGKQTFSRESPLFMEGDIIYHNMLPIDGPGRSIAVAWQYRESSWMLPFLQGPNRYVVPLIETVLNYDPYHQQWEKRLSKYFMWWLRTNASHTNKPALFIGKLLNELNLEIDERFPQRTKDRFEKAMNRIQSDKLLTWSYKEEVELPPRKWLSTWLNLQITAEDSSFTKQQHASIETKARAIKSEQIAIRPARKKNRKSTPKNGK